MVWSCISDQFQCLINLICLTLKKSSQSQVAVCLHLEGCFLSKVVFSSDSFFFLSKKRSFRGAPDHISLLFSNLVLKKQRIFSMKEITVLLVLLLLLSLLSSQCCSILTRSFITSDCPCIWLGILLFNIVERKTNKLHLSYLYVLRYVVSILRLACDWKIRKLLDN